MKKNNMNNDSIVDEMERNDRIAWGKTVPNQGYVAANASMEQRGRQQIAEAAERRGIESFPPAKQMLGKSHKP